MKLGLRRLNRQLPTDTPGRRVALKAISFALIGVVNTAIDAGVFFLAYLQLSSSLSDQRLAPVADLCRCTSPATLRLVAANLLAWFVAVTGSYVMNSSITFAAESGRRLRLKDYASFVASGVAGVVANTTTLVLAAQVAPVWAAKGLAILVSFLVNFLLSHFVVFRPKREAPADATRIR
jgi:putative flippase GtrA